MAMKKSNLMIVGIDPGKNGGIAVIRCGEEAKIIVRKMPGTPQDINEFFKTLCNLSGGHLITVIEKLHGMPHMSGTSMFKLGCNYGYLKMALIANNIRFFEIPPQRWQKHYNLGTKSISGSTTAWKNKLKEKAQQLYPRMKITLWASDAVLIAEYARLTKIK